MVPRAFTDGGSFLYPADAKSKTGKLRLLYEVRWWPVLSRNVLVPLLAYPALSTAIIDGATSWVQGNPMAYITQVNPRVCQGCHYPTHHLSDVSCTCCEKSS